MQLSPTCIRHYADQLLLLPDKESFQLQPIVLVKPFCPLPCLPPVDSYLLIGCYPRVFTSYCCYVCLLHVYHRKKDGSPLIPSYHRWLCLSCDVLPHWLWCYWLYHRLPLSSTSWLLALTLDAPPWQSVFVIQYLTCLPIIHLCLIPPSCFLVLTQQFITAAMYLRFA
jgi:hypothetical protein